MTATPHPVDQVFRDGLSWEDKAQQNPLYAVMSIERFADKGGDPKNWSKEDLEIFFAKGQAIYDIFLRPVLRRSQPYPGQTTIAEYGSGMGRILQAIKSDGYRVLGIDISHTMLEYSRRLTPEVMDLFLLNEQGYCDVPSASADFVFSYAVIQHICQLSRVQVAIKEICRILKPGGVLKIQFRTLNSPFRQFWQGGTYVMNFERSSLLIEWMSPANKALPYWLRFMPRPRKIDHTNWTGVPLSWLALRSFLQQNNVRLIGIEEDVGHDRMVWAMGRKVG